MNACDEGLKKLFGDDEVPELSLNKINSSSDRDSSLSEPEYQIKPRQTQNSTQADTSHALDSVVKQ